MFKIKLLKPLIIAITINLALFIVIYTLPFNPFQMIIGHLVSAFVFVFGFGIKLSVIKEASAFFLVTANGKMILYQTFYEFLTIIALTIPLYLKSWKKLLKKLSLTLAIMFGYYTTLYGTTIVLLEKGFEASFLIKFITYNTESFMIFAFVVVWFFVNRTQILKLINSNKTKPLFFIFLI